MSNELNSLSIRKLAVLVAATLVSLASGAAAQALSSPPHTAAADCRSKAANYQNTQVADLRARGETLTAALINPIVAEARRIARDCGAKISVAGASVDELVDLSTLDLYVGDTAQAKTAIRLATARTGLPDSTHADVLLGAEKLAIATWNPFAGINPEAERLVRQIDRLPDALIARKVEAHARLLARYDYADIDEGVKAEGTKLMAVARRALRANAMPMITPRPREDGKPAGAPYSAAYGAIAQAYEALARAAGDYLHADSALEILDEADRVVGAANPAARDELEAQRAMYRLVGTKATPIDGKWWINAPDGSTYDPSGPKVTVIQFTAHWCVPCRNSYPGFLRMNAHFAGKPVESVMVTDLYGFIGDRAKLTPDEEVAADRDYYVARHGLPFKIAINPMVQGNENPQDVDHRYAVNGIPEIVVVDRKGVIRATIIGWDVGNEKRLSTLIEGLLAER